MATTNAVNGFSHLTLTAFRGFRDFTLEIEARSLVFTGPNGGGKTNLLEAISFLAPGSGLRSASLREVDCRLPANNGTGLGGSGARAWAVHARYQGRQGEYRLGTGRDPKEELGAEEANGRDRRLCRIEGSTAKTQAAFAEILSILWLTPSMDRIFVERTSARRRFMDRLATGLHPEHPSRVSAYEQAMRDRARILRGDGPAMDRIERDRWLGGLEAEMAAQAVAIAASRLETAEALNAAMAEAVGPFPRADLAIDGAVEQSLRDRSALQAEDLLRERLASARDGDAASGITQWGSHRSDLAVSFHGKVLGGAALDAASASTGEQKALLISILLSQARLQRARRGEAPVLLLDEVAAHLDPERRKHLYAEVLALESQAWFTGTEADLFRPLREAAQFFTLRDARALRDVA
ncbi:DNA replication/repair protein RecF [Dongia sedimenti]|uniref:DNA replication and repair protein RecF n=1 Tax=Dongia sedimenti TaxID=3064282 RepID=A0ABU0YJV9_9PROT|nr:DNA replication/repair protein RecF [Rhodospirillaceae bacterium R-7]